MKTLFFARDIRGGIGERRVFRTILKWLAHNELQSVEKNIPYIAEYGSIFDYADHAGRKGKTQQGTGQVPCGTSTKDGAEVALSHGTKVGAYRCSS